MKCTIFWLIILTLSALPDLSHKGATPLVFQALRTVRCSYSDLSYPFIERVSNLRYNFVLVEFSFRASDTIYGNGDVFENLSADIYTAARKLDKYRLRLIPLVQMNSQWSLGWRLLREFENSAIGINSVIANTDFPRRFRNDVCMDSGDISKVSRGSNSWAPEREGCDKTIPAVFMAIQKGFDSSRVSYPLEFIHIGHDEPQFLNWCIIAGIDRACGTAYPYRGNLARGECSTVDSLWIAAALREGKTLARAYHELIADELARRVKQAEGVFGSQVKLIIYADMFDDQSWGGVPLRCRFGEDEKITLADAIHLPGLEDDEKRRVKQQVICMVWNYHGRIEKAERAIDFIIRPKYNTAYALDRLDQNGYYFMFVGIKSETHRSSLDQMINYSRFAPQFPVRCLGYLATAWSSYDTAHCTNSVITLPLRVCNEKINSRGFLDTLCTVKEFSRAVSCGSDNSSWDIIELMDIAAKECYFCLE